jgi:hypothetical protein
MIWTLNYVMSSGIRHPNIHPCNPLAPMNTFNRQLRSQLAQGYASKWRPLYSKRATYARCNG